MRELLGLYAQYNLMVTNELARLLDKLPLKDLFVIHSTYHQSIHRLYHHMATGSWHYLNAIRNLSGGKYCTDLPPLLAYSDDLPVESISGFLSTLSGILADASASIAEEDLGIVGRGITIYNGRVIDISVWQFFLQHITHQTHHQGQLSILLDELGVEHEFGNIFPLIPDAPER